MNQKASTICPSVSGTQTQKTVYLELSHEAHVGAYSLVLNASGAVEACIELQKEFWHE